MSDVSSAAATSPRSQALVGAGVLLVGLVMAGGATAIPSAAGYAGVGPNFLPWLVALALVACGARLLWAARGEGWADAEPPSGAQHGDWHALAWVAAGILADAALITTIGFVFANTLCFALAVRGLRLAEGRPGGGIAQLATDLGTGLAIALPVFWLFTRLLAINLPGLTGTGWL